MNNMTAALTLTASNSVGASDNTGETIHVRTDVAGRYNLNDLHNAAGGLAKHKPGNWLQSQQTINLITELQKGYDDGNPASEQNQPLSVVKGGDPSIQGTYVVKELVYAYAMWISPAFHLKVIRAYDRLATHGVAAQTLTASNSVGASDNTGETIHVRMDDTGRYCLNDLHKAAGGLEKHKPKEWLRNQQTTALVSELTKGGNPPSEQNQPLSVIHGLPTSRLMH